MHVLLADETLLKRGGCRRVQPLKKSKSLAAASSDHDGVFLDLHSSSIVI